VNGPERSVSRESVAAAKRKATARASMTPCWRQVVFYRLHLDSSVFFLTFAMVPIIYIK
jgi:hypothetical protein